MIELIVKKEGLLKDKIVELVGVVGDLYYCKVPGFDKQYLFRKSDLEISPKRLENHKELHLNKCPHCNEEIEIKCKSILGKKVLINQFYKYFKWHLDNECFSKETRGIKKVKITLIKREGLSTTYNGINLFV